MPISFEWYQFQLPWVTFTRKIFNDAKHRATSLRQLSFLLPCSVMTSVEMLCLVACVYLCVCYFVWQQYYTETNKQTINGLLSIAALDAGKGYSYCHEVWRIDDSVLVNCGPNWVKIQITVNLQTIILSRLVQWCCHLANEYEKALHGLQGAKVAGFARVYFYNNGLWFVYSSVIMW